MLLQMLVIVLLSSWIVEEYLNNIYLQAYVNDVVQADGSLIAILTVIGGLGVALGLFKVLKSTHTQIGALVAQPQVPTSARVGSSSVSGVDLHPMVAALKADMAQHSSKEPIPPVEFKQAPSTPVQAPPGPPPTRTLYVVPTTIVIGNLPVLKRTNPEQDKSDNSHR